jgi:hypothetical protein
MVDCRWTGPDEKASNGDRVQHGQKYSLASGLMEITYNTGAIVILQGPVTYEVETKNGGFMSIGKLTGKVENPKAKGFAIRTPTAIVTDLGTEFGVEVDGASGRTISHVFRGMINVTPLNPMKKADGATQVLHANQSARVEKVSGDGGHRVKLMDRPVNADHFVRTLSKPSAKWFDLVDVVAGGDGFSGRRGSGINPTNGRPSKVFQWTESHNGSPGRREGTLFFPEGDGIYHRALVSPYVDGVFIPDGSKGPVQLDSAGHYWNWCPKTANVVGTLIWAGGVVPAFESTIPTTIDGVDYASKGHGLVFLHPNSGITFDLDAVRKANPGCKIQRFVTIVGNTETFSHNGGETIADYWVLVDGEMRDHRWQVNSCNGGFSISISLQPNSRFLTLVTTDGGNDIAGDWIVFGDPRLELTETKSQHTLGEPAVKGGQ